MQRNTVLAALAGLTFALAASAQTPAADERGQLIARSIARVPAPAEIAVQPDDNTDLNIALAKRMTSELAQRGYRAAPGAAALVLRFDSETRQNVTPTPRRFDRRSSRMQDENAREGSAGAPDSDDEVTNLLSSRGNSVLGPRQSQDYANALRYVLNARLEDRQTGTRLWMGHVRYDSDAADGRPIFEAMIPLLIGEIGRTVQNRRFSLP